MDYEKDLKKPKKWGIQSALKRMLTGRRLSKTCT
ncbi:jg27312, partial [Pararge aegeria aegeria]